MVEQAFAAAEMDGQPAMSGMWLLTLANNGHEVTCLLPMLVEPVCFMNLCVS